MLFILTLIIVRLLPSESSTVNSHFRLPKRSCIGGHRHGSQVDFTRYSYYCNDGKLENRGCFADNRKRLKIGQLYMEEKFEIQCVEEEDGLLRIKYTSCIMDGLKHGPGETWDGTRNNGTWYRCVVSGPSLDLVIGGCIKNPGERINLNDEFVEESVVYKCVTKSDDTFAAGIEPVGCMHYAKRHDLAANFEDNDFWYTCAKYNAKGQLRAVKETSGCMHYGHKLRPDDRYVINDVIIQCKLRPFPMHQTIGCLRQNGERKTPQLVGSQWIKGTAPYQYVMQCNIKGERKATKDYRACLFSEEGGGLRFAIEPGCFTVLKKEAIACRKQKDKSLVVEKFKADQLHVAYRLQVRYCRPKSL